MKIQVRQSVFETNSSSTHTLSIFKGSDWERFEKGEMVITNTCYSPQLKALNEVKDEDLFTPEKKGLDDKSIYDYDYITYEVYRDIWNYCDDGWETIEKSVKDEDGKFIAMAVSYFQYG